MRQEMVVFGMQWHQLLHMQTICTSFQIHITAVSKDIFSFLLNPYFRAILSENLNGKNDREPALYQLVRKWNGFVQILRSCWHIPGFHWVMTNSSCFLVPYRLMLTWHQLFVPRQPPGTSWSILHPRCLDLPLSIDNDSAKQALQWPASTML